MKYSINGKNFEVSDEMDQVIRNKLDRLNRFFTDETPVQVTLNVDKGRNTVEVTIPVKGRLIRAEQSSSDMYVSLDLVEEIMERQLRKYKNKIAQQQEDNDVFQQEYLDHEYVDDEDIRIEKNKQFDLDPMTPEDACVQMELLGHDFYLFRNAETGQINVVYKRKGGSYGLIEPNVE